MGTEPKKPRKPLEKPLETRYGRPYSYRPEELTTLSPRSSVTHLVIPSPLGSVPRPKAARRGMERPRVEEKGGE